MNEKINSAIKELENWLADPCELGHKPVEIEFTNEFNDEDRIHCMIFKFKPTENDDWYLGIVSESGTFSQMQEYNKDTEIIDATEILTMLKNYWKARAKEMQQ